MDNNKKQHTIRVDDATWDALTAIAEVNGDSYRGRLSQGRAVERLVEAAQQPADPVPALTRTPLPAAPQQWRLSDVIALLPDKLQAQWARDGARCEWWVKQMLNAINSAPQK